jgi:hypothetical protein
VTNRQERENEMIEKQGENKELDRLKRREKR